MRRLWAAALAAAMASPASASTTVGFGALYDLLGPVSAIGDSLGGYIGTIDSPIPFTDSRSAVAGTFGPSTNASITASTRASIVNGLPSLGFSMSTTPLTAVNVGRPASTAVAVYDGLLLATPMQVSDIPPLTFNVRTTVSGTVDVTGLISGADGRLGTAVALTSDRGALEDAMRDATTSGNVIRTQAGSPVTVANRPLTLTADTTALPEAVWLSTGEPTSYAEYLAVYRAAVERCRLRDGGCAFPGSAVGPYTVGTVGIGVAFGGQMFAEMMGAASVSASNSLDIEGIFATDPAGEVVPMWIAGLTGVDYTLPAFAPTGPNPFAPAVADPTVVPLPATGLLLAMALGVFTLGRRGKAA